jgi:two-component system, NtrC family, sensor kinase
MKRRSKVGGAAVKRRRHTPKSVRGRSSVAAGPKEEVARLVGKRDEALEQLFATAEVLKVISSSPGELEPEFQALLENAVRICGAKFGNLLLYEEGAFRVAAMPDAPSVLEELRRREPVIRPGPGNPLHSMAATKQVQHVADL